MPIYPQPMYPHALRVRGRVGYAYIFRYRYNQEILKYYYPYNPKTAGQQAIRAKFATAITNWQGFDIPTKQFYNSKRYPENMSGYNRYLHYYLR